jgi:fibro-slime domain-containing protein
LLAKRVGEGSYGALFPNPSGHTECVAALADPQRFASPAFPDRAWDRMGASLAAVSPAARWDAPIIAAHSRQLRMINGHLAIDMGGLHSSLTGSVTLTPATASNLGLVDGGTYTLDVFKAERHICTSSYTVTLSGFVSNTVSQCTPE